MRDGNEAAAGAALLGWYDAQARVMPWRVGPADRAAGVRPDPYHVWLSEVMLQQTTVAAVRDYFRRFTARWPGVADLAAAEDGAVMAEWAGLGYYARARNLLKCARAVAAAGGRFPETSGGLRALPGIGPYTAAAVAAIAFDEPAVVVDGNVERVVARLWAVETPMPAAKPDLIERAGRLTPERRPGDHAQAMMDLGATICTPRNPACALCPVSDFCAAKAQGIAAELPRKSPKPEKPTRFGLAYVALDRDGGVLLERRPDKGLLGGMLGFPGSDWAETEPAPCPPLTADWTPLLHEVRHTFTHFHLRLRVFVAHAEGAGFTPKAEFSPAALPTVMRKVWDLAQAGALPPHPRGI
ncbi:A/G-specific adenine glycosylase [Rhodobacter capsulatus]|uniref:Adenine DNA glycosylase n=1 Tax=Rhodobacter capsulatus TaxID=1061 RepID=A0A1G7L704_RHOCA|nr:A/G-specific adenine glycosylase [Rhodobacter capsulatus]WER09620.1 A/G-specific adenine glycosylase [Rhodobacter capsulatus]SDF45104.1 A/G-specific DNA-adenine glycosylase [Rhodobacter capsulatus]